MSFFRSKEIDIKKEKVDEIEAFAEGKGLGERALGSKNDEFNDVIDKVFVVNVVIDEAIRYCKSIRWLLLSIYHTWPRNPLPTPIHLLIVLLRWSRR